MIIAREIDDSGTIGVFDRHALLELVDMVRADAQVVPVDHAAVVKLIRQTLYLIKEVVNHIEARDQEGTASAAKDQEDQDEKPGNDDLTLAEIQTALERAGATDM